MDDTSTRSGYLPDEAATLGLGASLAQAIIPGMVIFLEGDLGAGKTTLTRGLLQGLGHQGRVKSPTYTLVETYPLASMTAHHFDLYRFNDAEEWEDAGFRELFGHDTLCLVEWPEKAQGLLPQPNLTLALAVADDGRTYRIHAHDAQGIQCLSRLSI